MSWSISRTSSGAKIGSAFKSAISEFNPQGLQKVVLDRTADLVTAIAQTYDPNADVAVTSSGHADDYSMSSYSLNISVSPVTAAKGG